MSHKISELYNKFDVNSPGIQIHAKLQVLVDVRCVLVVTETHVLQCVEFIAGLEKTRFFFRGFMDLNFFVDFFVILWNFFLNFVFKFFLSIFYQYKHQ